MPYLAQQAPASLDTEGLRKYSEEQLREISRAWTDLESVLGVTIGGPGGSHGAASYVASAVKQSLIINGAMMVSQEWGTTALTASGNFPVDQFFVIFNNAGTQTYQQVFKPTPGGSPNRLRVTCTAADASVGVGEFCIIQQAMEGLRVGGLMFGTATAKKSALRFGVNAPAGTYGVGFTNFDGSRSHVVEYTISAAEAGTDVVKTAVIPGDITGTWPKDNTNGLSVRWALMAGSNFQQAPGVWAGTNTISTANQFNFMGTNGNVFELFDVALVEGSSPPPFVLPDYTATQIACQRYVAPIIVGVPGGAVMPFPVLCLAPAILDVLVTFPVQMRAPPASLINNSLPAWISSGPPANTNEVSFFNYATGGFATITGSLTLSMVFPSLLGCKVRFTASTSFSGLANGNPGNLFYGSLVRLFANARL